MLKKLSLYGITSLTPQQADAARLMNLVRCHWHIENKSHWVRDVTFGEDKSQVHCGNAPQVMAAFRNTAIGLARSVGKTNIAAACREFAAKPTLAMELIGITVEAYAIEQNIGLARLGSLLFFLGNIVPKNCEKTAFIQSEDRLTMFLRPLYQSVLSSICFAGIQNLYIKQPYLARIKH